MDITTGIHGLGLGLLFLAACGAFGIAAYIIEARNPKASTTVTASVILAVTLLIGAFLTGATA